MKCVSPQYSHSPIIRDLAWRFAIAIAAMVWFCTLENSTSAQSTSSPAPEISPPAKNDSVPSLSGQSTSAIRNGKISDAHGQYVQEYDLRPYTQNLKNVDRPEQAIVDWILRETGTDVWFDEPMGMLSANRNTLTVYHTKEMHEIVRRVYEKFVRGSLDEHVYGMRLITINKPNWRTRAMPWMKSVDVNSPGVDAWLLTKENAAIVLATLRGRNDFKELQAVDIVTRNGQTHSLEQMRSRTYIRDYHRTEQGWPPYMPVSTDIREGYRVQLSPLLELNEQTVDLVLKANIDQVEKLRRVSLDLPMPSGDVYTTEVNVPQVASWRLHERFRWPADHCLLLSCGVIAAPGGKANNTLLGNSTNTLGLDRLVPKLGAERADALLLIEYKGRANGSLLRQNQTNQQAANPLTRGRY